MRMNSFLVMAGALALAACGGSSGSAAVEGSGGPSPKRPGGGGDPMSQLGEGFTSGALWSCQISDYDPQPCRLKQDGTVWRLTKLLGSQRFDGVLTVRSAALGFSGEFFCPWGACDKQMELEFVPEGGAGSGGPWLADFDGDQIRLRYDAAVAAEYGGAGYGGLTGREQ